MASEITQFIETLLSGQDLTLDQSRQLLDTIFDGEVTEIQTAAFLTAMRAKGPKPAELAGLAKSLRQHAVKINVGIDNLVDTCGTGGAAVKTFNISTAAALVAAGAGVHIAKHGNRAITSNSGSADVLAQLGVKIDASVQTIVQCIK
ncbi:MAG: anthranilate phosphoribosyltransferase, partial [Planctomycetota bacterium]